ncbi:hypothetical protein D9M69_694150 [compost metagenome]
MLAVPLGSEGLQPFLGKVPGHVTDLLLVVIGDHGESLNQAKCETLWERACSRWGRVSQLYCYLTHRYREQARSHRDWCWPQ